MRTAGVAQEAFEKVPSHMREALRLYVDEHIEPGSFLRAVLENDLSRSFAHADTINRFALFDIVSYIYNWIPSSCWGSREKVQQWLKGEKP